MKPQFPTEQSESGEFQRQEDAFREWISNDESTSYPAVAGRYHLYVSLACPWASRTVIFRKLKGLEDVIGMTGMFSRPFNFRKMTARLASSQDHTAALQSPPIPVSRHVLE